MKSELKIEPDDTENKEPNIPYDPEDLLKEIQQEEQDDESHKSKHLEHNTKSVSIQFSCDVCEESFNKSDDLLIHMRMYNGEGQLECAVCGTSFFNKICLRQHLKTHTEQQSTESNISLKLHTNTKERTFKCDTCEKVFYVLST